MAKVVVPNLPATKVVVGRTESEDSGRQEMQQCWERKQPIDSHRPAAWICRGYSMAKNCSAEVRRIREAKGTGKETRLRREERILKLQENKYKRQKEDTRRGKETKQAKYHK